MPSRLSWMGFAALGTMVAACGVDTSLIFTATETGGAGGDTTTSVGEGGATSSANIVNSSVGVGGTANTGGAGAGGDDPMCLPEEVVPAELTRLDMLLLFDRTGSTGQFLGQEKLQVQTFAQSEAAPGTRMSLLFHGGTNSCSTMSYPAAIAMTPIPSQAQTIVDTLSPVQASGGSPWLPPLASGHDFAGAIKTQNPDHNVVVVMLFDSPQSQCFADVQNEIVPVAAAGLMAGVKTYVIGINQAPVGQLDPVAAAGGTGAVIDLTGNQLGQLATQLTNIRSQEIRCGIPMPTPTSGGYDPDDVAFRYGPNGGMAVDVPRVPSSNDCIGGGEGWYFDDPNNPTSIGLCEKTCGAIKVDAAPVLEVAFTCPMGG